MAGDRTPRQRAALVAWWLAHGEGMTTADVARLAGVKLRAAQQLMIELSCVLPILRESGVWQVCALAELDE